MPWPGGWTHETTIMRYMGNERIGLLGGTYNPIHRGHIHAAERVRDGFPLDRVLIIPSSIPPHKRVEEVAPPEHRLRMVELAVRGRSGFEVDGVEIRAGGRSYSIHTLETIRARFPRADIFLIIGIDAFLEIDTWREYRRVLDGCRQIVISRPGFRLEDARDVLGEEFGRRICRFPVSGKLEPDSPCTVFLMDVEPLDISSTRIRRRTGEGKPLTGLVDPAVEKYIKENGLYQGSHE